MIEVAEQLQQFELLPAIWFIFSRKGCDTAVKYMQGRTLTTPEERAAIRADLELLRKRAPETVREDMVEPLEQGVASHHAGLLPAWKALVERLFQRGLIKVGTQALMYQMTVE